MFSLIVLYMVLVGAYAKPEREHEMYNDLLNTAEQILDSMEYAKEYGRIQRDDAEEDYEIHHNDELNEWDMYSELDDEGVSPEYFQSFMLAEMADILLEAPLKDEEDLEPYGGRFLCGKCFKKYKSCKDVCFGLVAVSADHTIDFFPCATTCLQRISACCVAQRNLRSKNKYRSKNRGTKGNLDPKGQDLFSSTKGLGIFGNRKGQGTVSPSDILSQFQASLQAAVLGGFGGVKGETKGPGVDTKGSLFGAGMTFGQGSIFGTNIGQGSTSNKGSGKDRPFALPDKIQAILDGLTGQNKDKDADKSTATSSTVTSTTEESTSTPTIPNFVETTSVQTDTVETTTTTEQQASITDTVETTTTEQQASITDTVETTTTEQQASITEHLVLETSQTITTAPPMGGYY